MLHIHTDVLYVFVSNFRYVLCLFDTSYMCKYFLCISVLSKIINFCHPSYRIIQETSIRIETSSSERDLRF